MKKSIFLLVILLYCIYFLLPISCGGKGKDVQTEPRIDEEYEIFELIGKGRFGKVNRAKRKNDGLICAIKHVIFSKDENVNDLESEKQNFQKEVKIHIQLKHKLIIELLAWNESGHLILEYAGGADMSLLFTSLRYNNGKGPSSRITEKSQGGTPMPMGEKRASFYIAEISSALNYMHNKGIVSRDLKPTNVMLDEKGHIKLIDFGFAKDEKCTNGPIDTWVSDCTANAYKAPEILKIKQDLKGDAILRAPYDGKMVDSWTFGLLVFITFTGDMPFSGEGGPGKLLSRIENNEFQVPVSREFFSEGAEKLVRCLLTVDVSKRCSISNAQQILKEQVYAPEVLDWNKVDKAELEPPFVLKEEEAKPAETKKGKAKTAKPKPPRYEYKDDSGKVQYIETHKVERAKKRKISNA